MKTVNEYEAADILNVGHAYMKKLLERGEIPISRNGGVRHIDLDVLMAYRTKRDAERAKLLEEMAQLDQEMGFYD